MIYNRITHTWPVLAHAPGKPEFIPLWPAVRSLAMVLPPRSTHPENLTVVTFNNGGKSYNGKILGTLERSLQLSNITCTVLGGDVREWQNKIKISLMADFISKTQTPYVLFADSSDVVLINHLSNLVCKFKQMGCRAVFNAEKKNWPFDLPKEIVDFESSLHPFLFLNAGLWIADSEFARTLISECLKITPNTSHVGSEQAYYKFCYRQFYPDIRVDFKCELFQGLNRVGEEEIQITKVF